MKLSLKLEELAQFGLAIYLFSLLDFAWWWFPALLLTPDVGMLGYIANARIGALTYNLFHHKGVAIAVYMFGVIFQNQELLLAGCILFGHSAMDRLMGYGLKYPDSFQNTHLGRVGKQNKA
ncbi:DUF4260 domain-containing protein [Gilvibacter sediminis]|uniref:DUF4260 domain-containing protein n=1 Tax=Gilvibacter sediminis TaxID=379071 RepID=UPI00234FDBD1|nr:DUF4260 domain-containing protein [Gilvibacter sediminis]MDC7997277.1 DUF4260 domain-containing protein [Gilvibacter sediminis]